MPAHINQTMVIKHGQPCQWDNTHISKGKDLL